jgi:hypothetical protein
MNIPQALVEVLDITLAGFRKENESFLISILYKKKGNPSSNQSKYAGKT